ncbi:hypothetical protein UMM65_13870 [Aureibaculum sp. 2210JD6-5]|uniref:hypothetical protein n=1 Tax=Aureibaculum sp. 2210JD6-5 TaxID=3103957 RepID=UPI002AACA63A|nr:hypothetical protein [Aureibaculum sp. 2210JD6-5]MDY7396334.1 hypothetical protein [Aureibaculum sp. 2210JD6-5]
MKNKKKNKQSNKEKLEAIKGLLNPRKRKTYYKNNRKPSQEVTFMVNNNSELRFVISCLLRASIAALETEGTSNSPRLPYYTNEMAVVTLLELIDNILPDDQLEAYDSIEKLLLSEEKG